MTFRKAVQILMQCAERDVRGSGMGYRTTTDEWRKTVSEAWAVCFRKINKREPGENDYRNSGMVGFIGDNKEECMRE